MPEQNTLPLVQPKAPPPPTAVQPAATPAPQQKGRFVIPDDEPAEVVAPSGAPDQNKAEQAPAAKPEEKPAPVEEEVTPEQAAKREGRRFERRLSKAYQRAAEAQARAELLEKQLNEARAASKPEPVGKPTLAQFDYDPEKYATALADFEKKGAVQELQSKAQAEAFRQDQARLISDWETKIEDAEDEYDDWDEVVGKLEPVSPLHAAVMESDRAVAYYLGKNPKEAQRIAGLLVRTQLREIGKLEAKLLAEPKKPKEPSKAPAPITPVSATTQPPTDQITEEDDMKTFIRKRNKQLGRTR